MNERPTATIKTPCEKILIIKTYLTGREQRQIRDLYFSKSKMSITAEGQGETKVTDPTLLEEYENKIIDLAVISYDESAEAIMERLLDMPQAELAFVLKQASALNDVPKEEK